MYLHMFCNISERLFSTNKKRDGSGKYLKEKPFFSIYLIKSYFITEFCPYITAKKINECPKLK